MHHVYVDYRADLNTPFYVGKGNDDRVADFKNRNVIWRRIVRKHGVRREIVLTLENDHDTILSEEIRLIRELKTRDYRGGSNLTDGGEGSLGWNPTAETRKHMREAKLGKKLPIEHVSKMLSSRKEHYASDKGIATREALSVASQNMWKDPSHRQRMTETHSGERNGRAVITEDDVRQLRLEWSLINSSVRGVTKQFCVKHANRLGMTNENVHGIITHRSWKHVI